MNQLLGVSLIMLLGGFAKAQTQNVKMGQIYMGKELYNGHDTGNICYITVRDVKPWADKGLHCYAIDFQYNTLREELPKDVLTVVSRITNTHRPEYPEIRTCAMNVNSTTSGDEIYGEETSQLYNQIFGGALSDSGVKYDYFLTLGSKEKLVARFRIHVLKTFSEYDVDCVNLEKM